MTRSNIFISLSSGKKLFFVMDSSSAPEQEYIVEHFINPLLSLNDDAKELELIHKHSDCINELRTNASYRYEINLEEKTVKLFEEHYNYKTDRFRKGKDLTQERYLPYVNAIKQS